MEGSRCKSSRRASVAWVISVLAILMLFMYYGGQQNFNRSTTETRGHRLVSIRQGEDSDDMTRSQTGLSFSPNKKRGYTYHALGTTELDVDDDDFMRKQIEIQRQRHETLKKACEKYNISSVIQEGIEYAVHYPKRFIVDKDHELVYCSVAKIASTNWRLVFERLAGVADNSQQDQKTINRKLRKELTFMKDLTPSEASRLMDKSVSFVFARHPFSRVLSSYRNKLDPNSTFERADHWQAILGEKILNLYRNNIDQLRGEKNKHEIRQNKHKKELGQKPKVSQGYDLTFAEFVRFLGDENNKESFFVNNIHWADVNIMCDPCSVSYDVIGKLETIEDDAKYILKLANVDKIVNFPSPNISSPTFSSRNDVLTQYLKDVPAKYIYDLYKRYEIDFELFGYDLPPVAERKIQEMLRNV